MSLERIIYSFLGIISQVDDYVQNVIFIRISKFVGMFEVARCTFK